MAEERLETRPYFTHDELQEIHANGSISKDDMYKLVIDFLVSEGHIAAADKICDKTEITPGENFTLVNDHLDILKALLFMTIEGALVYCQGHHPWALARYRTLFTNMVKLKVMDLIVNHKEEEASHCYLESMKIIAGDRTDLQEEWMALLHRCNTRFNGAISSAVEQGRLAKKVFRKLKTISEMTAKDDVSEIDGPITRA